MKLLVTLESGKTNDLCMHKTMFFKEFMDHAQRYTCDVMKKTEKQAKPTSVIAIFNKAYMSCGFLFSFPGIEAFKHQESYKECLIFITL